MTAVVILKREGSSGERSLSVLRIFFILPSEEGLTSLNKDSSANFSNKKSTRKLSSEVSALIYISSANLKVSIECILCLPS